MNNPPPPQPPYSSANVYQGNPPISQSHAPGFAAPHYPPPPLHNQGPGLLGPSPVVVAPPVGVPPPSGVPPPGIVTATVIPPPIAVPPPSLPVRVQHPPVTTYVVQTPVFSQHVQSGSGIPPNINTGVPPPAVHVGTHQPPVIQTGAPPPVQYQYGQPPAANQLVSYPPPQQATAGGYPPPVSYPPQQQATAGGYPPPVSAPQQATAGGYTAHHQHVQYASNLQYPPSVQQQWPGQYGIDTSGQGNENRQSVESWGQSRSRSRSSGRYRSRSRTRSRSRGRSWSRSRSRSPRRHRSKSRSRSRERLRRNKISRTMEGRRSKSRSRSIESGKRSGSRSTSRERQPRSRSGSRRCGGRPRGSRSRSRSLERQQSGTSRTKTLQRQGRSPRSRSVERQRRQGGSPRARSVDKQRRSPSKSQVREGPRSKGRNKQSCSPPSNRGVSVSSQRNRRDRSITPQKSTCRSPRASQKSKRDVPGRSSSKRRSPSVSLKRQDSSPSGRNRRQSSTSPQRRNRNRSASPQRSSVRSPKSSRCQDRDVPKRSSQQQERDEPGRSSAKRSPSVSSRRQDASPSDRNRRTSSASPQRNRWRRSVSSQRSSLRSPRSSQQRVDEPKRSSSQRSPSISSQRQDASPSNRNKRTSSASPQRNRHRSISPKTSSLRSPRSSQQRDRDKPGRLSPKRSPSGTSRRQDSSLSDKSRRASSVSPQRNRHRSESPKRPSLKSQQQDRDEPERSSSKRRSPSVSSRRKDSSPSNRNRKTSSISPQRNRNRSISPKTSSLRSPRSSQQRDRDKPGRSSPKRSQTVSSRRQDSSPSERNRKTSSASPQRRNRHRSVSPNGSSLKSQQQDGDEPGRSASKRSPSVLSRRQVSSPSNRQREASSASPQRNRHRSVSPQRSSVQSPRSSQQRDSGKPGRTSSKRRSPSVSSRKQDSSPSDRNRRTSSASPPRNRQRSETPKRSSLKSQQDRDEPERPSSKRSPSVPSQRQESSPSDRNRRAFSASPQRNRCRSISPKRSSQQQDSDEPGKPMQDSSPTERKGRASSTSPQRNRHRSISPKTSSLRSPSSAKQTDRDEIGKSSCKSSTSNSPQKKNTSPIGRNRIWSSSQDNKSKSISPQRNRHRSKSPQGPSLRTSRTSEKSDNDDPDRVSPKRSQSGSSRRKSVSPSGRNKNQRHSSPQDTNAAQRRRHRSMSLQKSSVEQSRTTEKSDKDRHGKSTLTTATSRSQSNRQKQSSSAISSGRPELSQTQSSSSESQSPKKRPHSPPRSRKRERSLQRREEGARQASSNKDSRAETSGTRKRGPFTHQGSKSSDGRDKKNERAPPRRRRRSPEPPKKLTIEDKIAEVKKLLSFNICDNSGDEASDPPWTQCSPKEHYYSSNPRDQTNGSTMAASTRLKSLQDKFQWNVVERGVRARSMQEKVELPELKLHWHVHEDKTSSESSSSSSESSSESEGEIKEHGHQHGRKMDFMARMKAKMAHPYRLAEHLWFNDPGEMNDAPICTCSYRARQTGIRHDVYPGEISQPMCDPYTNNAARLYHYRITVSPCTNYLSNQPTVIEYDEREYIFEGFSMFSHYPLTDFPECTVVRFNREYTIHFLEEPMPENFTVRGLDLFADFLFEEVLELHDFELKDSHGNGCRHFHFMPRFARRLPNNGKEILSMHHVIQYLLKMDRPIVSEDKLEELLACDPLLWANYAGELKNMIATCPGKKPTSVRIDQLDRDFDEANPRESRYPVIVHFGVKPPQLTYAGDIKYQKLMKNFLKMRHLLANKPKVTKEDKDKLLEIEQTLNQMRYEGGSSREVTAEIDSMHAYSTGMRSDICQHAMMLPVLVNHVRYFSCLHKLEDLLGYSFKDKMLLKHAMTHPSFRLTYGTNPDHVRNSLVNCGIRQPDYGDRKMQSFHSRKKGINTLIRVMSCMPSEAELPSHIHHYERLEFLGDAVVEFVTSTHLYFLFPDCEEGILATYRQALVQNQHLAVLAKKLDLDQYLLYAHGPDLCRGSDLRHATANCFEAIMGALYLEAGLVEVRRIFCQLLFDDSPELQGVWTKHPQHPLQMEFPNGDREMIEKSEALQKITKFEGMTGITFKHIRLLARAFTQRTVGYTNLTKGHNQRMEFLGDSVLQLITSTYLYRFFPDHHEGHLSLLRSCLVNNKTQATVALDLGMDQFIIYRGVVRETGKKKDGTIPTKQLADILEAFLGALYVDSGMEFCQTFCDVCFFPRLEMFIRHQEWNDAKSQLQQCVLTLRSVDEEPEVPYYKVIGQSGPTNTRQYTVAVYFQNERLGKGTAGNVQDAQMEAAKDALRQRYFPQFQYQQQMLNKMKLDQGGGNMTDNTNKDARKGQDGPEKGKGQRGPDKEKGQDGPDKRTADRKRPRDVDPSKDRWDKRQGIQRNDSKDAQKRRQESERLGNRDRQDRMRRGNQDRQGKRPELVRNGSKDRQDRRQALVRNDSKDRRQAVVRNDSKDRRQAIVRADSKDRQDGRQKLVSKDRQDGRQKLVRNDSKDRQDRRQDSVVKGRRDNRQESLRNDGNNRQDKRQGAVRSEGKDRGKRRQKPRSSGDEGRKDPGQPNRPKADQRQDRNRTRQDRREEITRRKERKRKVAIRSGKKRQSGDETEVDDSTSNSISRENKEVDLILDENPSPEENPGTSNEGANVSESTEKGTSRADDKTRDEQRRTRDEQSQKSSAMEQICQDYFSGGEMEERTDTSIQDISVDERSRTAQEECPDSEQKSQDDSKDNEEKEILIDDQDKSVEEMGITADEIVDTVCQTQSTDDSKQRHDNDSENVDNETGSLDTNLETRPSTSCEEVQRSHDKRQTASDDFEEAEPEKTIDIDDSVTEDRSDRDESRLLSPERRGRHKGDKSRRAADRTRARSDRDERKRRKSSGGRDSSSSRSQDRDRRDRRKTKREVVERKTEQKRNIEATRRDNEDNLPSGFRSPQNKGEDSRRKDRSRDRSGSRSRRRKEHRREHRRRKDSEADGRGDASRRPRLSEDYKDSSSDSERSYQRGGKDSLKSGIYTALKSTDDASDFDSTSRGDAGKEVPQVQAATTSTENQTDSLEEGEISS